MRRELGATAILAVVMAVFNGTPVACQTPTGTLEFPSGTTTVRLPARIEHEQVFVRVTIGERGLDLLLDTGASGIVLNRRIVRELGLREIEPAPVSTRVPSGTQALVPLMKIGPLALHDIVVSTQTLFDFRGEEATLVVGLLGFDFIRGAVLRIDYGQGKVDAIVPSAFSAPPAAVAVPVDLREHVPMLALSIGGSTGDRFVLDTGADATLVVGPRFMRLHPPAHDPSRRARKEDFISIAGEEKFASVTIHGVSLGPWNFDTDGYIAQVPESGQWEGLDGLLGAHLLSAFTLYLDYANDRVLFELPTPTASP